MADEMTAAPLDSAEKAYAEAAQAVPVTETPAIEPEVVLPPLKSAKPVKAPAKAKAPVKAPAPAKAKAPAKAAPASKPAPAKKAVTKKAAKPVSKKTVAPKSKAVPAKPATKPTTKTKLKDTIMTAKTKTTDFTATIKDAFADVQGKAKTAYAKGAAAATEAGEFSKGNFEAFVESGKILADGFKALGTEYVAEGKKAYETLSADAKELATIKSPTDFFQFQAKILRRNFDSAVAFSSKNTEATVKLVNEAFAPISGRVSLVVEKVKKAA